MQLPGCQDVVNARAWFGAGVVCNGVPGMQAASASFPRLVACADPCGAQHELFVDLLKCTSAAGKGMNAPAYKTWKSAGWRDLQITQRSWMGLCALSSSWKQVRAALQGMVSDSTGHLCPRINGQPTDYQPLQRTVSCRMLGAKPFLRYSLGTPQNYFLSLIV